MRDRAQGGILCSGHESVNVCGQAPSESIAGVRENEAQSLYD